MSPVPHPEHEGGEILARIHCRHGHVFTVVDQCEPEVPRVREPTRRERRRLRKELKRMLRN